MMMMAIFTWRSKIYADVLSAFMPVSLSIALDGSCCKGLKSQLG